MGLQLLTGNDLFMFIDTLNSDVDLNYSCLDEDPELNEMPSKCSFLLCLKVKKLMCFFLGTM